MQHQHESRGNAPDSGAGAICLDLANLPDQRLATPVDLVDWAHESGLIDRSLHARLRRETGERPRAAAATLGRARKLKALITRLFSGRNDDCTCDETDVARLNAQLARTLRHARLAPVAAGGFRWDWDERAVHPDRVLWPIVRSAAELLASDELALVRECDAEDCSWLFVDRSRTGRRRWCDMKVCGNRAKARRHYRRRRARG